MAQDSPTETSTLCLGTDLASDRQCPLFNADRNLRPDLLSMAAELRRIEGGRSSAAKALHRNHIRVRVHREADLGMTEHVHDHSGRNVIMDLEGLEFNEPNTFSKSARAILGRD